MSRALKVRHLDARDPSAWPTFLRVTFLTICSTLLVTVLWWVWLRGFYLDLEMAQSQEIKLRHTHTRKLGVAMEHASLAAKQAQVQGAVAQFEKQLPGKAEMATLLASINQAGLERGLVFEHFRPGIVLLHPFYAEWPIGLRVTGRYSSLGDFVSDIAHFPQIVRLEKITITSAKDGLLTLDATALIYRVLDAGELGASFKVASQKGLTK